MSLEPITLHECRHTYASFLMAAGYALPELMECMAHSPLQATERYVALLVAIAAPVAGRMVDGHGERLTAMLGFCLAAIGLAVLAIPSVSLTGVGSIAPLVPVGVGLGLLFVPASRAALNANPAASHGRTSAVLSIGRLLGAGVGAGLSGIALTAGLGAATLHTSLLCAALLLCAVARIPAAAALGPPLRSASEMALG